MTAGVGSRSERLVRRGLRAITRRHHPKAWLQVARGTLTLDGEALARGDGVGIEGGGTIVLADGDDAEVLLFELP